MNNNLNNNLNNSMISKINLTAFMGNNNNPNSNRSHYQDIKSQSFIGSPYSKNVFTTDMNNSMIPQQVNHSVIENPGYSMYNDRNLETMNNLKSVLNKIDGKISSQQQQGKSLGGVGGFFGK